MANSSKLEHETERYLANVNTDHVAARFRTQLERAREQRVCEYFEARDGKPKIERSREVAWKPAFRTVCIGRRVVEVEEFEEPVEREIDTLDLVGGRRVSLLESIQKQVNARRHCKGRFR